LYQAIKENPFPAVDRNLFYGGGEPLIAPAKFAKINKKLSRLKNTNNIVATNGCALPLDKDEFQYFVEQIGNPFIFLTLSPDHQRQYSQLAAVGTFPDKIPSDVDPAKAIYEKIGIINEYCADLGIGFTTLNLMDKKGKHAKLEGDLRKHIIERALREVNIHHIPENERRDPCSQGQELAIRANGDLYPYCTDIFNGHPKLGVIGLLKE
jgi:hypothetical protein